MKTIQMFCSGCNEETPHAISRENQILVLTCQTPLENSEVIERFGMEQGTAILDEHFVEAHNTDPCICYRQIKMEGVSSNEDLLLKVVVHNLENKPTLKAYTVEKTEHALDALIDSLPDSQ